MSSVELIVIEAEASDDKTVWSNRLTVRADDWFALEGAGMHEVWARQVEEELRRTIPEGLEVRLFLRHETFPIDEEED